MLHEIGVELGTALKLKGCPFVVVDGPEDSDPVVTVRERIVIQENDEAGDSFGPTRGAHTNKDHRLTCAIACKLTIYARSAAPGAKPFEHRRRARQALDAVLTSLDAIASVRRNAWSPKSGKFVTPADLEGSKALDGAVYELLFTFDRAVMVQTWAGGARPETTLGAGGIKSTTKVSMKGGVDNDADPTTVPASAETACGA